MVNVSFRFLLNCISFHASIKQIQIFRLHRISNVFSSSNFTYKFLQSFFFFCKREIDLYCHWKNQLISFFKLVEVICVSFSISRSCQVFMRAYFDIFQFRFVQQKSWILIALQFYISESIQWPLFLEFGEEIIKSAILCSKERLMRQEYINFFFLIPLTNVFTKKSF